MTRLGFSVSDLRYFRFNGKYIIELLFRTKSDVLFYISYNADFSKVCLPKEHFVGNRSFLTAQMRCMKR